MEKNNVMPRLCGLIVSAMLTVVVIMTTWNSGVVYAHRIQAVSLIIVAVWFISLIRAKGRKQYRATELLLFVVFFCSLGLFLGYAWHRGYITNTPIIGINAETEGIFRDTLYHNAIASSIEYYGYPSLLVNSGDFHNYHFGSHLILGLLSAILRMPSIFTYCYLYPVLFFSIYPALILSVGVDIRKWQGIRDKVTHADVIILLGFMTYYFWPQSWSESMGNWKLQWLISESFCVAIVFGLLFFKVLFIFYRNGWMEKGKARVFFVVVVVPVFIILTGLAKISVGLILTFAICWYLLRKHGFTLKYFILEAFYVAVILLVHFIPSRIYSPILSGSTEEIYSLSFLDYLRTSIGDIRMWGLHILFFFLFAIVFIVYRLRKKESFKELAKSIKEKEFLVEETFFLVCIVGLLPGMFIAIGGGSAFYFIAIQQVIAATLLIGYDIPDALASSIKCKKVAIYKIAAVFVLVCLSFNYCFSAGAYAMKLVKDCGMARVQYEESIRKDSYWYNINQINILTDGHKGEYYIYVCDSADIWNKYDDPDSALFFYPAMTGIVCIGEMYYEDGELYTNDGVPKTSGYTYKPNVQDVKMTEEDAYHKAVEDGKKAVIYIDGNTFSVRETGSREERLQ